MSFSWGFTMKKVILTHWVRGNNVVLLAKTKWVYHAFECNWDLRRNWRERLAIDSGKSVEHLQRKLGWRITGGRFQLEVIWSGNNVRKQWQFKWVTAIQKVSLIKKITKEATLAWWRLSADMRADKLKLVQLESMPNFQVLDCQDNALCAYAWLRHPA